MISMSSFVRGPTPNPMCFPTALPLGKKWVANRRFTIATLEFSLMSRALKSRPSSTGICIVSKYRGDNAFMNACMSSPSPGLCPSTDIELSHSSPARMGTVARPADFMPGRARTRSSSC